jgi:CopG family transcriptional regulator/antitoxin EndoAI
MYQEIKINITLPEQTVNLIEQMSDKGNISRFVEDAVKYYIEHAGKTRLYEQLKQGAVKRAERDLKLSQEWNSLDFQA